MSYSCDNCDRRIVNVVYKVGVEVLRGPADTTDRALPGHFCCPACLCQHSERARGPRPNFDAARRLVVDEKAEADAACAEIDLDTRYDSGELQANVDQVIGILGRKSRSLPGRNWGLSS
jgi:hypothetical protein